MTTGSDILWTGRCLCGAVRYEAKGRPLNTSLCHCEDCRRASGSPFQGWVFFRTDHFQILCGELRIHAYQGRERSFCAHCGSPVTFTDQEHPELVEVTLGTMDTPDRLRPDDHNWMTDHLSWVPLVPHLPQYPHNGPPPCLN